MPVTAEQFRDALSKLENGEDLLEYHASTVAAEKERGIQSRREANKEAQNLRKYKIAMEQMGFDPQSQADVDEFAKGIVAQMESTNTKATGEIGELQKTLKKLQQDFTATQTELKTEREQRAQLQQQNKLKTIESKLLPKLQEEYYGANFIVKALLADGAVDLDESTGEVVFKKGDSVLPLADGLKTIAEQNPDARRNKQQGGAGSSASVQPNRPKFTMDQIRGMTQEQVKANLQEVNDSMRALQPAK